MSAPVRVIHYRLGFVPVQLVQTLPTPAGSQSAYDVLANTQAQPGAVQFPGRTCKVIPTSHVSIAQHSTTYAPTSAPVWPCIKKVDTATDNYDKQGTMHPLTCRFMLTQAATMWLSWRKLLPTALAHTSARVKRHCHQTCMRNSGIQPRTVGLSVTCHVGRCALADADERNICMLHGCAHACQAALQGVCAAAMTEQGAVHWLIMTLNSDSHGTVPDGSYGNARTGQRSGTVLQSA